MGPGLRRECDYYDGTLAGDPGLAAAEIAGLRGLRRGGLRRHRPDIKRVAMKAAAAHVAAAAKIDPLVVGDDLGEDLLPWREIDVAVLVGIDAVAVDGDVVMPRRHIAIERAPRLGDRDDRAIEAEIGAAHRVL